MFIDVIQSRPKAGLVRDNDLGLKAVDQEESYVPGKRGVLRLEQYRRGAESSSLPMNQDLVSHIKKRLQNQWDDDEKIRK